MKTSIKFLLIFLGLSFILSSCSKEGVFYGNSMKYYDSGILKKGQLASDTIIDGYPCTSWVYFYPSGNLKQFSLAQKYSIAGNSLPAKTVVFLSEEGNLTQVYLTEDQMIQGYQCTGGNIKSATGFYPSGKLLFFFPRQDTQVGDVLCMGGSLKGITLYVSGNLKKAYAAKEVTINGKTYKKGDLIEL